MKTILESFRKIRNDINSIRNDYKNTNELSTINQIDNEEIRRAFLLLADSHKTENKYNTNRLINVLSEIVATCSELALRNEQQHEKLKSFEKITKIAIPVISGILVFIMAFSLYTIDPVAFKDLVNIFVNIFGNSK